MRVWLIIIGKGGTKEKPHKQHEGQPSKRYREGKQSSYILLCADKIYNLTNPEENRSHIRKGQGSIRQSYNIDMNEEVACT